MNKREVANSTSDDCLTRVLIADDEKIMRDLLSMSLERLGYEVTAAGNGQLAMQEFEEQKFDLVILDVMMPEMDGFEACASIRDQSDVPIVMLTALGRPDDVVKGIELGADSYIIKPFVFKEVEARIRALMRRAIRNSDTRDAFKWREFGDLRLNNDTREVTIKDTATALTETEFNLFDYLLSKPDQPVSKKELLENVWGYSTMESPNLVELAIRRLRKKIEENPSSPKRLITVRGIGYKLRTVPIDESNRGQHRHPSGTETIIPPQMRPLERASNSMAAVAD